MRTKEIKNEIDEIKKWEQKIKRRDLKCDQKKKKKKNRYMIFSNMKR